MIKIIRLRKIHNLCKREEVRFFKTENLCKYRGFLLRHFYIVTMEGFEPSRPCEHHPLKMASLPFLHMAKKIKGHPSSRTTFCDPTGARTQDPIIKSDVLYRLSYRVISFLECGCKYKDFFSKFPSNFIINLSFFN